MLNTLSSPRPPREQALDKIKLSILSILANPWLRGRVQFLPPAPTTTQQTSLEVNFAILYEQNTLAHNKVKKAHVCFRFDPLFPEEGPACIQVEMGEGSTFRSREIHIASGEMDKLNLQSMLISILVSLSSMREGGAGEVADREEMNGANKSQSFMVSRNSCFSRIQAPSSQLRGGKGKGSKAEECRDSNSSNMKGKRNSKPMKKNANLPKFLIRIFIKYLDKFRKIYPRKEFDRLYSDCKKMKEWKRTENKQHALGLKHLKQLFQEEKSGYPDPDLNRKVVIKIISEYLLEEICQNSQIPETHRLGYLVACRVYALRCRNAALAGRIQSK